MPKTCKKRVFPKLRKKRVFRRRRLFPRLRRPENRNPKFRKSRLS